MNVAICVCTYRRPDGLKNLLNSLNEMRFDGKFALFVVDNDPDLHEGYNFLAASKDQYPFDIFYEIEPKAGISHARNKSLTMVKNSHLSFDYVAFTDDDVVVSQRWIHDLVSTSQTYDADLVSGKCEPVFNDRPKDDILYSCFFIDNFAGPPTGTKIISAGTNNMLVRIKVFKNEGYEVFDPLLTTVGGEDVDFCTDLVQKKYNLIRCSAAIVYETFPPDRLNEKWILNRYYRGGTTYAYILKKRMGRKKLIFITARKLILFPLRYAKAVLSPTSKNKCQLQNELGFFHYLVRGYLYEEYKRTKAHQ